MSYEWKEYTVSIKVDRQAAFNFMMQWGMAFRFSDSWVGGKPLGQSDKEMNNFTASGSYLRGTK